MRERPTRIRWAACGTGFRALRLSAETRRAELMPQYFRFDEE
jgi:hypothetical protein